LSRAPGKAAPKAAAARQVVKTVNLALQRGGSHGAYNGAYTWGVLDALAEDTRIEISAISATSAGTMNGVVFAAGMDEGGRDGAREKLGKFWHSVSSEGSLSPLGRRWVDSLNAIVDFDRLRASYGLKLYVAVTNIRTGRGEIFRHNILTVDHVMASACPPELFLTIDTIGGEAYWEGGFTGNPPLWPLFYETRCLDTIIIQINPIERADIPRTPAGVGDRVNEIASNTSLLAELRSADFVGRLVRSGALKSEDYRQPRLHRISLEAYRAATKNQESWLFLRQMRDLGRADAKKWLEVNFDAIGVEGTLRDSEGLSSSRRRTKAKPAAS
jgi:NTE family protein